jgi:hypothetical protein
MVLISDTFFSSLPVPRSHKRALSAPNFPSPHEVSSGRKFSVFPAISEPPSTSPMELHIEPSRSPERRESLAESTGSEFTPRAVPRPMLQELTPPVSTTLGDEDESYEQYTATDEQPDGEIRCMLTQGKLCNLEQESRKKEQPGKSHLRKVISHFFGRNKACTRAIPEHVWVHICRKHYQRGRYRNATVYARQQAALVKVQIRRIQNWSNENQSRGTAEVLRGWNLQCRKRESNRRDDLSSAKGKKRARPHSEDEEDDDDSAVSNGTAVPTWLSSKIGQKYSTEEIYDIVNEIHRQLKRGDMKAIPDIEILPDVEAKNGSDPMAKKPSHKRQATHQRSQSMGQARPGTHLPAVNLPLRPGAYPPPMPYSTGYGAPPTVAAPRFPPPFPHFQHAAPSAVSRFPGTGYAGPHYSPPSAGPGPFRHTRNQSMPAVGLSLPPLQDLAAPLDRHAWMGAAGGPPAMPPRRLSYAPDLPYRPQPPPVRLNSHHGGFSFGGGSPFLGVSEGPTHSRSPSQQSLLGQPLGHHSVQETDDERFLFPPRRE